MESTKKPCICIFCFRRFARSDALRRHWNSCGVRRARNLPIPTVETKARGRKIRACDQCRQLKRACTSLQPCAPCASRSQVCKYSRPQESRLDQADDASSFIDDIDTFNTETHGTVECRIDNDLVIPRGDIDNEFDMHVYESVFESLDNTNDHSDSPMTNFDHEVGSALSSQRNPDSPIQLNYWTSPSSLSIEHGVMATLCQRPTQLNINLLIQFPFLDNFTKATGFVGSFSCGTKQQRLSITSDPLKANPGEKISTLREGLLDAATHWVDITRNALVQTNENIADTVVLLPITHKIVHQIRETAINHHHRGPADVAWSPLMEALCYAFFNPTNLQKFMALFWSCWYPNWPTIHVPTFRTKEKSPELIAVIALIGACLSPEERDRASALVWFDLVEDLVFSDDAFHDHDISNAWRDSTKTQRRSTHLQVLQAAYCVCLYQTWEGSKRSKQRVLRQRFNDLVYLARDIGLDQASLKRVDTSYPADFDWEEYVLRESLIRICSYICNIDASYALFFRHVPRMALSELIIEMSSPESCFQASSKEECFIELNAWRKRMGIDTTNLTILSAVNALCDDAIMAKPTIHRAFAHLSVLNMFTIIHALYLQVYGLETSAITALDMIRMAPITKGLRNWQLSWSSETRDVELVDLLGRENDLSTMWQRIGFMRYAPEYWLITYTTLKKLYTWNDHRSSQVSETAGSVGYGDMVEARRLITKLRSGSTVSAMDSNPR